VTAYYLRADADELMQRFHDREAIRVLENSSQKSAPPLVVRGLEILSATTAADSRVAWVYGDAVVRAGDREAAKPGDADRGDRAAHVARIGGDLVCFTVDDLSSADSIRLTVHGRCSPAQAKIEKIPGYLRSDCRVVFPGGTRVEIAGTTLRSYESYFAPLREAN